MKLLSGLRWLLLIMLFQGSFLWAMGNDAPLLTTVHLDRLEWLNGRDENMLQWQLSLVSGHDLQKLVLETEGERSGGGLRSPRWRCFINKHLMRTGIFWPASPLTSNPLPGATGCQLA
ncbi:MAG: copper resistance protein B [Pseudomonadales bacterium]|nr:copper resistance protein B [Pseudomonadales bacterium]